MMAAGEALAVLLVWLVRVLVEKDDAWRSEVHSVGCSSDDDHAVQLLSEMDCLLVQLTMTNLNEPIYVYTW